MAGATLLPVGVIVSALLASAHQNMHDFDHAHGDIFSGDEWAARLAHPMVKW